MTSPLRRRGAAVLVAVATSFLLTGPVAQGTAANAHPAPSAPSGGATTVTLLTGDVVTVTALAGGKSAVEVTRPRDAVGGYRTESVGKHIFVLPDEALPFLAAGTVDRRLFDVTTLLESGYDDAHSGGIPLIVAGAPKTRTLIPSTAAVRSLPSIDATAIKADKAGARSVWQHLTGSLANPKLRSAGYTKIWLDGKAKASMVESNAQIGTPAAWSAGLDGHGVKVAVLDTGVDQNHPDLAGRISQAVSFVPGEDAGDRNGHGTHTASTIGGSGAASGGAEKGVAPKSDLLVGKVLSDEGFGQDSWIIDGMEWAADQGAKVISMSLGSTEASDGTDPMAAAVNEITERTGALFVIAAGNTGTEAGIGSPGAADSALTIGAVDADDALTWFSSKGPRYKDYSLKPDLTAPGNEILAAKAGGNAESGWYESMSGTSMATPHVAGVAAILAQQHPDWKWAQLKDALMSTSKKLDGLTAYQVGAGRVDVQNVITEKITATGSAYFGFFGWAQDRSTPVTKTITYANAGDSAVTLHLAGALAVAGGPYDVAGGAGGPGPRTNPEVLGLSAQTVTVPAHGTATVDATADPSLGAAGTRYLGEVVATDATGAVHARTQVGFYIEDERYTLDIKVLDRSGKPLGGFLELQKFGPGSPWLEMVDETTGTATLRLRGGVYSALMLADVAGIDPDALGAAVLGDPEIVLDRDRSIVLDGRKAVQATATVPGGQRTEDQVLRTDWYRWDGTNEPVLERWQVSPHYDSMFVLPTKKVTRGEFEVTTRWRKTAPLLAVRNGNRDIAVFGQGGSQLYSGKGKVDGVLVGNGTPADYAGKQLKGKVAIAKRSDDIAAPQRAQAAADAGAVLLLVINDEPGRLLEWVGGDDDYSRIPVASMTARDGAALIASARNGKIQITADGTPNSPFLYDLLDPHTDQVPGKLAYKPRTDQLARVEMVFHGDATGPGSDFRYDLRSNVPFGVGYRFRNTLPGTRTDWVSAVSKTEWHEVTTIEAVLPFHDPVVEERSGLITYRGGQRVSTDWFSPVVRPRLGLGAWQPVRYAGYMAVNITPWTDGGAGHAGFLTTDQEQLRLRIRKGDTVLEDTTWQAGYADTDPEKATYTIDLEAARDPSIWKLSPKTHTTWVFQSQAPAQEFGDDLLPLVQLDYDVETNLAGAAWPGLQVIGVKASHMPGVVGAGKIGQTTVAVSFDDGKTWKNVPFIGGKALFFTPPGATFVSLRATAKDSAGNSVSQEVIRAYALRSIHS
ncbi:subtilisin family serine protease [Allocatelliglobosispora scoriae]|uniref:Subtilisin family serine protease n=1 Tax=Allocatelliglobosispora scoriae TaxID=643052 RepID=A0A841BQT6_9ACTN|nr:S8 family serine peptidase [Allocatelliglobosispora scoriae]MBB5869706.1 subtilisin family serine protease [Allocatelliglobosispora scoriae]